MTEFATTASLVVSADQASLRRTKQTIEDEIGEVTVDVAPATRSIGAAPARPDGGSTGPSVTSGTTSSEPEDATGLLTASLEVQEQQLEHLEDIADDTDFLGGAGSGGLFGTIFDMGGDAAGGITETLTDALGPALGTAIGEIVGDVATGDGGGSGTVNIDQGDLPLPVEDATLQVDQPSWGVGVEKPGWAPFGVGEPEWVPLGVDKPEWAPLGVNKPEWAPLDVTKPDWVPLGVDKPVWVPLEVDDPSPLEVEDVGPIPVNVTVSATGGGGQGNSPGRTVGEFIRDQGRRIPGSETLVELDRELTERYAPNPPGGRPRPFGGQGDNPPEQRVPDDELAQPGKPSRQTQVTVGAGSGGSRDVTVRNNSRTTVNVEARPKAIADEVVSVLEKQYDSDIKEIRSDLEGLEADFNRLERALEGRR